MAKRSRRRARCAAGRWPMARPAQPGCALDWRMTWLKPTGCGVIVARIKSRGVRGVVPPGQQSRLGADRRMPGLLDAQDRQEERPEDQLAAHHERGHRRDHQPQRVLVVELAELVGLPVGQREDEADQARRTFGSSGRKPSAPAYTWVNSQNSTAWNPITTIAPAATSVSTSKVTEPMVSGPMATSVPMTRPVRPMT